MASARVVDVPAAALAGLGKRQLRTLVGALPTLVAYLDPHERHRALNPAYAGWIGRTQADILGRTLDEMLGEELYGAIRPHLRAALAGQLAPFEASRPAGPAPAIHVRGILLPDYGDDGRLAGVFLVLHDIADIRHREHERCARLYDVGRSPHVSVLSALLTQVAHELRQPLSAIGSFCDAGRRLIAKGGIQPDRLDELLQDVATQAERAGAILQEIRRILEQHTPRFTATDLNGLIRGVLHLMALDANRDGVRLRFDPADDLPPVRADRILIEQVMVNLLRNAFEAMANAPQDLRVAAVQTQQVSPRTVRVSIRDRGVGIPSARPERIFEPSFSTKATGMGMGLPICRSIVELHGGRLSAAAAPEGGTLVSFTLSVHHATQAR
jgi:signal transduction histidine kinase